MNEPLSSKSFSAILNPSSVVVIVFILSLTIAELLLYKGYNNIDIRSTAEEWKQIPLFYNVIRQHLI